MDESALEPMAPNTEQKTSPKKFVNKISDNVFRIEQAGSFEYAAYRVIMPAESEQDSNSKLIGPVYCALDDIAKDYDGIRGSQAGTEIFIAPNTDPELFLAFANAWVEDKTRNNNIRYHDIVDSGEMIKKAKTVLSAIAGIAGFAAAYPPACSLGINVSEYVHEGSRLLSPFAGLGELLIDIGLPGVTAGLSYFGTHQLGNLAFDKKYNAELSAFEHKDITIKLIGTALEALTPEKMKAPEYVRHFANIHY